MTAGKEVGESVPLSESDGVCFGAFVLALVPSGGSAMALVGVDGANHV